MRLPASAIALLMGIAVAAASPLATQREVKAEIEINAPPELVWKILTDFPSYPIWNPYIYPAKGELRTGAQLELTLHPGDQHIPFRPVVLSVEPNKELSWGGRTLTTGVFDRVQTFTIEPLEPTRARLVSREVFTGLLTPFYGGLVDDTRRGLEMMTSTLRTRAELFAPPPKSH